MIVARCSINPTPRRIVAGCGAAAATTAHSTKRSDLGIT
jgi:hypothetical protein